MLYNLLKIDLTITCLSSELYGFMLEILVMLKMIIPQRLRLEQKFGGHFSAAFHRGNFMPKEPKEKF